MKLPVLKPKKMISILRKNGFYIDHQTGSHITLLNNKTNQRVTVSYHSKDIKRGTLQNILKQAGINMDEFIKLLKK
ncbi:MAG: YcfA family protein [Berkelbacteria bacterium GW2011_GWA1_36_9]|uniref:YcfA family protein n=1 Tax=Berkelbacteria bacterium GW2011_GWA1_36_9 TaxID=1618331 RepID=A0A0G0FGV9_9BACT|nr:MAG: YcfA family protein [Berkelbacteria bacterium GW2011_GWA1_36_9]